MAQVHPSLLLFAVKYQGLSIDTDLCNWPGEVNTLVNFPCPAPKLCDKSLFALLLFSFGKDTDVG